jgi:hypothetical protein
VTSCEYKLDDLHSISDKGTDLFSSYTENDYGDHFVPQISYLRRGWPEGKDDHLLVLRHGFDLNASNYIAKISKELRSVLL